MFLIAKGDSIVRALRSLRSITTIAEQVLSPFSSLLLFLFQDFFASGAIAHLDDINATSRFAQ